MLTVNQALEIMQSGQPFTVQVCTYDEQRQSGGDFITFGPALLSRPKGVMRSRTGPVKPQKLKRRNNDENDTTTIHILGTSMKRTIHNQLIFQLNGIQVI